MSAKKLFSIRCVVDIVVQAESEAEAREVAVEAGAVEEARNGHSAVESIREVAGLTDLPSGWRGSYPYGGDGEKTCREIIEAGGQ